MHAYPFWIIVSSCMAVVDFLAVGVAAGYSVCLLLLTVYGLHWGWWACTRRAYTDTSSSPAPPDEWPAVTVQLPLYNEPDLAPRLIDACARFDYPLDRLHIQVLDDSTDRTSRQVAERVAHWKQRGVSISHIQRSNRAGYKAGALAYGLARTDDDFIAVFDADFLPPASFLKSLLPHFTNASVGLVQARWAHCNAMDNWCTQGQAAGLNAHFALEQAGRYASNAFMHFNGTAGIWRRTCIDEAGGWEADTLTEDLDLSYRAQLAGWTFRYVEDVEVPAELPRTISAWRTQQFRWAKGAIETARKLLQPLWNASIASTTKLAGTIHLLAHLAFPAIVGAALLHAPLLLLAEASTVVGPSFLGTLGVGVLGFIAFGSAVWYAQRTLGTSISRTLRTLPAFFFGSMGLAVNNTHAVFAALQGVSTPFQRTPKATVERTEQRARSVDAIAWSEFALGSYCVIGLGALVHQGLWVAVPFQAALALSFLLMAGTDFWQSYGTTTPANISSTQSASPCEGTTKPISSLSK